MQLFIDSAIIDDIRRASSLGCITGVTTNPSLMAKAGRPFKNVLLEIAELVHGPISGEVSAAIEDAPGMIREGREIAALHPNMVVKLPLTSQGLEACAALAKEGVRCNMTLIFTPAQALLAARAGAAYVSPFVGRLNDIGVSGIEPVRQIADMFRLHGIGTEIIAASIRSPEDAVQSALAGAHIATLPLSVLLRMICHPLTDIGIAKFREDQERWKA